MKLRTVRVASGQAGHLRVAFVASATPELVPSIALAFRAKYPLVTLELKNLPTVLQVEALEAHAIDVGFVRLPLTAPRLAITRLHSEPFALVLPKGHPLVREKRLNLRMLASEPFRSLRKKVGSRVLSAVDGHLPRRRLYTAGGAGNG